MCAISTSSRIAFSAVQLLCINRQAFCQGPQMVVMPLVLEAMVHLVRCTMCATVAATKGTTTAWRPEEWPAANA